MTAPLFSLLLHLEDGVEATLATLTSIAENTPGVDYDTLILDDATSDATQQLTGQLSGTVQVWRSENRIGQAAALSRLAVAASAPVTVIIRQGALLTPGWHAPLLGALEDPYVIAAQSLAVDEDGHVVSAGLDLTDDSRPIVRWLGHRSPDQLPEIEQVDAIDGTCTVLRTDALVASGGLDDSFPAGALRFAALSRRLTASGQRLVVANGSRVIRDAPLDVVTGVSRFQRLAPAAAPGREQRPRTTTVALYLPAFHRIPENDRWWGEGFTEWTNVVKAQPLFDGHEQPHLPADLGLYDLRLPSARAAQAELAEQFGIGAFCYYHYWFNGRRLLEQPFAAVRETGTPALPFCLCWANEPWRANWDGSSGEMLMPQTYSAEDDLEHIGWLCEVFEDPRYLRVNGRPIFLIYRAKLLPDVAATLACWRQEAERRGIGELFLCRVESFDDEHDDARELGFDASVEFQPDWLELAQMPSATGPARALYDYRTFVRHMLDKPAPEWRRIPCVTPQWDNTARRGKNATMLVKSRPDIYRNWVETVSRREEREHPDSPMLFVNAWNEWGEGAHLEPGSRWGTSYLEAHRDATRASGRRVTRDSALCIGGLDFSGVAAAAAWLHGSGVAIDTRHELGPVVSHAGDAFRDVDELAIRRHWPDSHGWRVSGDVRGWFSPAEVVRATSAVQARRRSHPQWGWADPRSTLLLESWADLVPELGSLLLWSPCLEVAHSLVRATASSPQSIDLSAAVATWLTYNRRALEYRRLYPEHCVLAPASALSSAPEELLGLVAQKIGLSLQHRSPEQEMRPAPDAPADPIADAEQPPELEQATELEQELRAVSDLQPAITEPRGR